MNDESARRDLGEDADVEEAEVDPAPSGSVLDDETMVLDRAAIAAARAVWAPEVPEMPGAPDDEGAVEPGADPSPGGVAVEPTDGGAAAEPPTGESGVEPTDGGAAAEPPTDESGVEPTDGDAAAEPPAVEPTDGGAAAEPPAVELPTDEAVVESPSVELSTDGAGVEPSTDEAGDGTPVAGGEAGGDVSEATVELSPAVTAEVEPTSDHAEARAVAPPEVEAPDDSPEGAVVDAAHGAGATSDTAAVPPPAPSRPVPPADQPVLGTPPEPVEAATERRFTWWAMLVLGVVALVAGFELAVALQRAGVAWPLTAPALLPGVYLLVTRVRRPS